MKKTFCSCYNKGFSIVELLVVVVTMGILVAITLIAYSGATSRADASVVQSDLTVAAKKSVRIVQCTAHTRLLI